MGQRYFYDENGNLWDYNLDTKKLNCGLKYDYHMVERGFIYLCEPDGEVIGMFALLDESEIEDNKKPKIKFDNDCFEVIGDFVRMRDKHVRRSDIINFSTIVVNRNAGREIYSGIEICYSEHYETNTTTVSLKEMQRDKNIDADKQMKNIRKMIAEYMINEVMVDKDSDRNGYRKAKEEDGLF